MAIQVEFNYASSEQEMDRGIRRAINAQRVQEWKRQATAWLRRHAIGDQVTADDLIRDIGIPDIGANRVNVVGAWFSAQSKSGFVRWSGAVKRSKRTTRHTGIQRVWIVNDWLAI